MQTASHRFVCFWVLGQTTCLILNLTTSTFTFLTIWTQFMSQTIVLIWSKNPSPARWACWFTGSHEKFMKHVKVKFSFIFNFSLHHPLHWSYTVYHLQVQTVKSVLVGGVFALKSANPCSDVFMLLLLMQSLCTCWTRQIQKQQAAAALYQPDRSTERGRKTNLQHYR